MKAAVPFSLLLAFSLVAFAAEPERPRRANVQAGQMSSVQLLATARVTQGAPDGMRFLFLVTPTPGTTGQFTIKETRDFLIDGKSYWEMSQLALGRKVEPSTVVDSAEGFFAKQPGARRLAPPDIRGAQVLAVVLGGGPLPPGASGEVSLHVGFNQQVESFTFPFTVRSAPSLSTGVPPAPAAGRTRYVVSEGVGFAPWTFDLALTEATVSGAIFQHGSGADTSATTLLGPFEIYDGRVAGQTVTFKARSPTGERVVTFTGQIADNQIEFARSVEVKPGADPGMNGILGGSGATNFIAKRAAQ